MILVIESLTWDGSEEPPTERSAHCCLLLLSGIRWGRPRPTFWEQCPSGAAHCPGDPLGRERMIVEEIWEQS